MLTQKLGLVILNLLLGSTFLFHAGCAYFLGSRAADIEKAAALVSKDEIHQNNKILSFKELYPKFVSSQNQIGFIALGDMGTGDEGQKRVSDAIKKWCAKAEHNCDFGLFLGDNIYPSGLDLDVNKAYLQWQSLFLRYYSDLDFPQFLILGNHDYSRRGVGSPNWDKAQSYFAMQKMTQKGRQTKNNKAKWYFPYDASKDSAHPSSWYQLQYDNLILTALDTQRLLYGKDTSSQLELFNFGPKVDTSDKIHVVIGHHPLYSNGLHGNAGNYGNGLAALTEQSHGMALQNFFNYPLNPEKKLCDTIDIYISGHEHNRQIIKKDLPCQTLFIVSGAGGKTDRLFRVEKNTLESDTLWQAATLGFTYFLIKDDQIKVNMINAEAEVDYSLNCVKDGVDKRLLCREIEK